MDTDHDYPEYQYALTPHVRIICLRGLDALRPLGDSMTATIMKALTKDPECASRQRQTGGEETLV